MGTFIFNALKNLFKSIVIVIVSIMTLVFMFAADVVSVVIYPFWAWRNPCEASEVRSLSDVLNWRFLDDIVNSHHRVVENKFLELCQAILRPFDAVIVRLWNAAFLHCAPMNKRKFFIDQLGNNIQKLSWKVQVEYFEAVDFDRRVYLLKNNMLSEMAVAFLYYDHDCEIVYAGKLTDAQFKDLGFAYLEVFCSLYDLNLQKQKILVSRAVKKPSDVAKILRLYIMRRGLHPLAVKRFYELCAKLDNLDPALAAVTVALECRQDLVTVLQTENARNQLGVAEVFAEYLKSRGKLGYEAQVSMSAWQYEIFHVAGLKLMPNAVHEKLARVNKNNDSQNFVRLMMKYGEVDGNEIALHQVSGDEKLSAMWLKNLSETA